MQLANAIYGAIVGAGALGMLALAISLRGDQRRRTRGGWQPPANTGRGNQRNRRQIGRAA